MARGVDRMGAMGLHLIDAYPGRDEEVPDLEWIRDAAGDPRWSVLTQNPRILTVDAEREAIASAGTRVFCLSSATLTNEGKGLFFGRHWLPILRRTRLPGPCFWRLYPDRIKRDIR